MRIKRFNELIVENQFQLKNPIRDGATLSDTIKQHRYVEEKPPGSNQGPEVNQYLKSVGVKPGNSWCAAFVYYVMKEFAQAIGVPNPVLKIAGVMKHWEMAPQDTKIDISKAKSDPTQVKPGQIFIMKREPEGIIATIKSWVGSGYGHTGIIMSVNPKSRTFVSIEGNTDDSATGEGDRVGVNVRKIDDPNLIGFIDYFRKSRTPDFEKILQKTTPTAGAKVTKNKK